MPPNTTYSGWGGQLHSPVNFLFNLKNWISDENSLFLSLKLFAPQISLFRTTYSEKATSWLRNMIIENFGEQKGAIIATISEMEEMGFSYTPEYIFNDLKLSGVLNYVEHILSKQNNIPIDTTTSRIVCPVPGFSNLEIAEG